MIKQREYLHNPFHENNDVCNEFFQFERRLSFKEDDMQLQQSSLVLNGVEEKVSVQEVAKVQKREKKLRKEGIEFINFHCWFHKGMV